MLPTFNRGETKLKNWIALKQIWPLTHPLFSIHTGKNTNIHIDSLPCKYHLSRKNMKATSCIFTKRAVCIIAAASLFHASPTAAWSWPWSGVFFPSEEVEVMTWSDLSSTTAGLRLTYWTPSYTSGPVEETQPEPKRKAAGRHAPAGKSIPVDKPSRNPIGSSPGLRHMRSLGNICFPKCGNCLITIVDFDKAADGTPIKRGDYLRDEWKSLGTDGGCIRYKKLQKGRAYF